MDDFDKKVFEEFKFAVAESIRRKANNDKLSILNFEVMTKAKKLSGLSSRDIFSALIETVVELEATKFALSAATKATDASKELIESYRAADAAAEEFSEIAVDGIESLDALMQDLNHELEAAPKRLASAGGKGRANKYDVLKNRVYELYDAKKWNSSREAAQKIEAEIIELSKQAGVPFSGAQPWETIHKWILNHIKK